MARLITFVALIYFFISTTIASPPSFCKCTCFTNSTIIALSTHSATCSSCDKKFCLSQSLPICKNAAEKDVTTTCFARDSRKDQIVVLTFIAGTVGLLVWAGIKRVLEKRSSERSGGEVRIGEGAAYEAVGRG